MMNLKTKGPMVGPQLKTGPAMKRSLACLPVFALLAGFALASPALAQTSGQIALTSGQPLIHSAQGYGWQPIWPGQTLGLGDAVFAQGQSRARLELGPTVIELRPDSQMDWAGQEGRSPVLRLDRGTADLAVTSQPWGNGLPIVTPWGLMRLEQAGAYRVAQFGDSLRITVWQGSASLPEANVHLLPGQQAIITSRDITLDNAPPEPNDIAQMIGIVSPSYAPPPPVVYPYREPEPPQVMPNAFFGLMLSGRHPVREHDQERDRGDWHGDGRGEQHPQQPQAPRQDHSNDHHGPTPQPHPAQPQPQPQPHPAPAQPHQPPTQPQQPPAQPPQHDDHHPPQH